MYSKHAKCMLMENSPHADFEVCFYNGMKFSVWSSYTHSAVVRVSMLVLRLNSAYSKLSILEEFITVTRPPGRVDSNPW